MDSALRGPIRAGAGVLRGGVDPPPVPPEPPVSKHTWGDYMEGSPTWGDMMGQYDRWSDFE